MIAEALRAMTDELPLAPLYRHTLTWVMCADIDVVRRSSDVLEVRSIRLR